MHYKSLAGRTAAAKLRNCWGGLLLLLALGSPILLPSAPAFGQEPGAASPERHALRRYKRASIDDQVKGLARNLDLSEAQQSEVKRVLERRQLQMRRMLRDPSTSGSDRIYKFRALQAATVEQIRAVLNDEQKKKYGLFAQRPPQQTSPQPSVEDWMKATPPH